MPHSRSRATIRLGSLGLLALLAASCGSAPSAPSVVPPPAVAPEVAPSAPAVPVPFYLVGQSNAVLLRDCCLPGVLNTVQGGTPIEVWTRGALLAEMQEKASRGLPVVWWQGENSTTPDYRAEFQRAIDLLRAAAGNPQLPIRIVEIANTPQTQANHDILQSFDGQPGIRVIRTNDLPLDGVHFQSSAYPIVLDRIYRSLAP